MRTAEECNRVAQETLPGYLGVVRTHVAKGEVRAELPIKQFLMALMDFFTQEA